MGIIKVAIIEDNPEDSHRLAEYLERYIKEANISLLIRVFVTGEEFLDSGERFQLVFMDVELPGENGIVTAEKMRNRGGDEVLILVTNMVRYAVHGYAVKAVDYMVKPVLYEQLALKLPGYIAMIKRKNTIIVKNKQDIIKIKISKIHYIEIYNHDIYIHLEGGTEECHGSLREFEEQLYDKGFARCSQSCLVNLAFVDRISQNTVKVAGDELQISRREKRNFTEAFTTFDGGYGL